MLHKNRQQLILAGKEKTETGKKGKIGRKGKIARKCASIMRYGPGIVESSSFFSSSAVYTKKKIDVLNESREGVEKSLKM